MNLNMSENITVKNLTSFPVGFRKINGGGEVNIPPHTSVMIERAEVISKVQSQSELFWGADYDPSHAYLYIEDKPTRVYVGFDTETEEQSIINEDKIKAAFAMKTTKAFENAITKLAVTFAEKQYLVDTIKHLEINDYNKIKFVEKYTGMAIDEE